MKSLQESLFDSNLIKKDIGILTVITNELAGFISGKKSGYSWIRLLLGIIKDIKYNVSQQKREYLGLEKISRIEEDDLYVYISINDSQKEIFLLGKGLDDLHPRSPVIIKIGYSQSINTLYADMFYMTVSYKEKVNNENFQHYKVSKDEIKTFIKEILDNIEHVF